MKNDKDIIKVFYYYEEYEENGKSLKIRRSKALNNYKIYKVIATYGGNSKAEYYVRAFNYKQAKKRFTYFFDWLKILKVEETDLTEEYFNENLRILI